MNQQHYRVARFAFAVALVCAVARVAPAAEWRPAKGPLTTRWAKDVAPDNVHPEYPRPQIVRGEKSWTNLNGLWDYAIRPQDDRRPDKWDGQILVPFAVESALSGVMKKVGPENRLWYRRWVPRSELPKAGRLLLHFAGCDWHTSVWINGIKVGEHKGGYDPFTFDVTDAFGTTKSTRDEIVVSVWDPTDGGFQPRGKQVRDPHGIWYTSVTGIWQTVWLERVPKTFVQSLKIVPDIDNEQVLVTVAVEHPSKDTAIEVSTPAREGRTGHIVYVKPGKVARLPIPKPRLWSPDDPHLYELEVAIGKWVDAPAADNPRATESRPALFDDRVTSYFGMRKVEIKKDDDGFNRIFLNNRPLFLFGPLDQGWWPDGLYTAPTDAALKYDIEMTKKLGMNMARKHVKVEPARWYYWCDKLGLLVWQDMPNGDRHIGRSSPDFVRSRQSEENFRREWRAIVDANINHPSIVAWVPFNEGWGQFKTNEILAWTKKHDPTRLVDGPSGWTDRGTGDIHDIHSYPGPAMPAPEDRRAVVLGEFGGLGWPVKDHLWWDKRNWGYRTYKTQAELQQNYEALMHRLRPLIGKGLAAAIYTQTTDVEGEVNGLMTYDRALVKLDASRVAAIHRRFYLPPPIFEMITYVPTSEKAPQKWRFTTTKPAAADWAVEKFADAKWKEAPGGFGEKTTPGSVVRTDWKTSDIWLRRTFFLNDIGGDIHLRVHHDEDAEIYVNGKLVASIKGYTSGYIHIPLPGATELLHSGDNTIAVHCRQTTGGQYIDVGIVGITEKPRE